MFKGRFFKVISGVTIGLVVLSAVAGCAPVAQPGGPQAGSPPGATEGQQPESSGKATVEVAKERGGKLVMSGSVTGNPNDPHLTVTGSGRDYAVPVANGLLTRGIYNREY